MFLTPLRRWLRLPAGKSLAVGIATAAVAAASFVLFHGHIASSSPPAAGSSAPAGCGATLFEDRVPANPEHADGWPDPSVDVGVTFRSSVDGSIAGIRFYKSPLNVGTHYGHLWTITGTELASLTFTDETASGWQEATFATPVPITAGTTYVASWWGNSNYYPSDLFFFDNPWVNGPLRAFPRPRPGSTDVIITARRPAHSRTCHISRPTTTPTSSSVRPSPPHLRRR